MPCVAVCTVQSVEGTTLLRVVRSNAAWSAQRDGGRRVASSHRRRLRISRAGRTGPAAVGYIYIYLYIYIYIPLYPTAAGRAHRAPRCSGCCASSSQAAASVTPGPSVGSAPWRVVGFVNLGVPIKQWHQDLEIRGIFYLSARVLVHATHGAPFAKTAVGLSKRYLRPFGAFGANQDQDQAGSISRDLFTDCFLIHSDVPFTQWNLGCHAAVMVRWPRQSRQCWWDKSFGAAGSAPTRAGRWAASCSRRVCGRC